MYTNIFILIIHEEQLSIFRYSFLRLTLIKYLYFRQLYQVCDRRSHEATRHWLHNCWLA